jgi:hypothetical protein
MRLTLVSTLALAFLPTSWAATPTDDSNAVTTVQSLTLERTLIPADFATTLPVPIPAPVIASVASGTLEIRERFVYPPVSGVVNYTQFSVPAGTPIPTPSSVDISGSTYFIATLAVQKISVGANTTYPSVQFSGTIASTQGPLGSITGTPAALSFGYTTGTDQTFNNVLSSISGVSSGYSAAAVGQMTLTQVPISTNPCGGPLVITAPTIVTTTNQINLDASQSFDCAGGPLFFQWNVLNPLGSVTLYNPTLPMAYARLNAGPGQYSLTVTVTNANKVSTTSSILVTYTNP